MPTKLPERRSSDAQLAVLTERLDQTNAHLKEIVDNQSQMIAKHNDAIFGKDGLLPNQAVLLEGSKRAQWKDRGLFAFCLSLGGKFLWDAWHK